jgi:hypothetical protein
MAFKQLAVGVPKKEVKGVVVERVKGFVETAVDELHRRNQVYSKGRYDTKQYDEQLARWKARAQQTGEMAQLFTDAVEEAVTLLAMALQGWDLRKLYRKVDEELEALEKTDNERPAEFSVITIIYSCLPQSLTVAQVCQARIAWPACFCEKGFKLASNACSRSDRTWVCRRLPLHSHRCS